MMIIAHRGASSYAPENTFAAFDLALEMGAKHIELDAHCSSDGHVVVIHDDDLDRTTNGAGPVAHRSLAELRALDAGSWFSPAFASEKIPALNAVLARYKGKLHIHAEIKGVSLNLSQRVANLIRQHGLQEQATITSFQKDRLEEMRAYAPELPTGWLVTGVSDTIIAQARALGLNQICPPGELVTPELVRQIHDAGFSARAWGVGTEALMKRVIEAGADGMTVNFPDKAIAHLNSVQAR
jgi:glycerophosphoryl diester phosphodiesterase